VHVQLTHGGHMLAPVLSDEHFLMAELVRRNKGDGHTVIPENFCSGRGLPLLYRAVCDAYGYDAVHTSPAHMLDHPHDPAVRETLRLFHEFFGLFAHLVVVTGNAYGGLYLDGGVLHHLRTRHLFDADTFLGFMTLNPVDSVKRSLDQCPVHLVLDPYIALRGLQVMMEQN
jgi:glucokinase